MTVTSNVIDEFMCNTIMYELHIVWKHFQELSQSPIHSDFNIHTTVDISSWSGNEAIFVQSYLCPPHCFFIRRWRYFTLRYGDISRCAVTIACIVVVSVSACSVMFAGNCLLQIHCKNTFPCSWLVRSVSSLAQSFFWMWPWYSSSATFSVWYEQQMSYWP